MLSTLNERAHTKSVSNKVIQKGIGIYWYQFYRGIYETVLPIDIFAKTKEGKAHDKTMLGNCSNFLLILDILVLKLFHMANI